ncbi:MAG: hypothetical protein PVG78_15315 [Desulfobacterales bacterium]|jgi:hypothetical protein
MKIPPAQLPSTVFQRVIREETGQVSLDSQTLTFFVEVDGKKTAAEIAEKCGLAQAEVREIVDRLLEAALIEPLRAAADLVDLQFMAFLQRQLSMAIGPIAGVIIEDALADLGLRIDAVPTRQAPELVEVLAREIQREQQRIEFKQNMVKIILEKGYSA